MRRKDQRRETGPPSPPAAAKRARIRLIHAGIVLATAFAVYANSLTNELVWDDHQLIVENPAIRSWRGIPELFASDLYPAWIGSHYYRPLQALTYAIDCQVWQLNPAGYHLTSILLHACVSLLLYFVGLRITADPLASLLAAVLFAVHPVHTATVAYVAGRSDPLAWSCGLLTVLLFLRGGWWLAAAALAFLATLMARETAIVLLALLPVAAIAAGHTSGRPPRITRIALSLLPLLVAAGLYLALRVHAIGWGSVAAALETVPLPTRVATFFTVMPRYLGLLAVPVNLHMERFVAPLDSPLHPLAVLSAVGVIVLLVVAVRLRSRLPVIWLALMWWLIALIPVSNLVPLTTFMAEHWLYGPFLGLSILVGWGVARAGRRQKAVLGVALVVLAGYAAATVRRNQDWSSDRAIYAATLRSAPHSVRASLALAVTYATEGDLTKAGQLLDDIEERMRSFPHRDLVASRFEYSQLRALQAHIYRQRGDVPRAEQALRAALELNPGNVLAINQLASLLGGSGRTAEAIALLQAGIRIDASNVHLHNTLGNLLLQQGDLAAARQHYRTAVQLEPTLFQAFQNLGLAELRLGHLDAAIAAYEQALALNPELTDARRNLAIARRARNQREPAP